MATCGPMLFATLAALSGCARAPIGNESADAQGDDPPNDDDDGVDVDEMPPDDALPPCDGPYCSDPANCGAPGVKCLTTFSIPGDCHRGLCATGSLCMSELFDPPPGVTCDDACTFIENPDTICLENGCGGNTAYKFPDIETCEGLVDELTPLDLACDDPIPFDALGGLSMRCCCITP